jgi:hypothetical protein
LHDSKSDQYVIFFFTFYNTFIIVHVYNMLATMLKQWNCITTYFSCEKPKLLLIKCDPKKIQSPSLWKGFLNPSSQVSLHLHIDHLIQFWYYNFRWKDKWEIAYDWIFFHHHVVDALPSPGVNPLEGSPKCNCGKLGLGRRSRLLAL